VGVRGCEDPFGVCGYVMFTGLLMEHPIMAIGMLLLPIVLLIVSGMLEVAECKHITH
jgi:hypothetical protein